MVAESPPQFAQALDMVDPAASVAPGVWSPTEYLWHMVDVVRIGTERLWTLTVAPESGLPSWDENELARVRSYGDLSGPVGLLAYRRAVEDWVTAARGAPAQARATHPEFGTVSTEWVIARNAHEAQHHLLDIEQVARHRSEHVFIARSAGPPDDRLFRGGTSRLFDDYVMVDWSASSFSRTGKDSIWIGAGSWRNGTLSVGDPLNEPTRHSAVGRIEQMVDESLDAGRRILIGFDFPFSYPAGLTSLAPEVFGPGPPWRAIWRTLAQRISDAPDNTNNRWDVAKSLNRDTGYRLFWGCPNSQADEYLGTRDKELPGLRERGPRPDRLRLTERRAQSVSGVIQTEWKLAYAGSVGSQALMGIPRLEQLRSRYGDRLRVWPFETDIAGDRPTVDAPVTLVEIWPSIFPTDFARHPVRDAAQVLQVVESCAAADAGATMISWLTPRIDPDSASQVAEEGWILGGA
jgi:hypothetical protein